MQHYKINALQISWHDMAFFDPVMYEGLRKLILSAHQEPEHIRDMGKNDIKACVKF